MKESLQEVQELQILQAQKVYIEKQIDALLEDSETKISGKIELILKSSKFALAQDWTFEIVEGSRTFDGILIYDSDVLCHTLSDNISIVIDRSYNSYICSEEINDRQTTIKKILDYLKGIGVEKRQIDIAGFHAGKIETFSKALDKAKDLLNSDDLIFNSIFSLSI